MTGDQQWPAYEPAQESPWGREPTVLPSVNPTSDQPAPHVPYGGPSPYDAPTPAPARRRGRTGLFAGLPVVALIAGVAFTVQQVSDDSDSTSTDSTVGDLTPDIDIDIPVFEPDFPTPQPGQSEAAPPDLHSTAGFADLLDALRARNGSTKVFEAVVYPEYASLDVPVDVQTLREESLYYNGELEDSSIRGTATGSRIDLADVDPALLVRLLARAARLVDDPTSSYAIIRGRSTVFPDDGTRILAYASNEFSETAYIATRLDGTVVRQITP